ncbi:MAG: CARDB domain-containing protein [Candidatus Bathyarchaeia archaeon]
MKESFSALMLIFLLIGLSMLVVTVQLAKAEPLHDIAIINITLCKTVVGVYYPVHINVTVENQGDFTETFNVTVYANATAVGLQSTMLSSGNLSSITFTWEAGYRMGNYTISANATILSGETDTADNTFTDDWVFVTIPGDIDGDRDVDIFDVVHMAKAYGTEKGTPRYKPVCDIDDDGDVDIFDLVSGAGDTYGWHW